MIPSASGSFYYYYSGYPDMMEKASIFSALQLYMDFINLFLYLLRFLGKAEELRSASASDKILQNYLFPLRKDALSDRIALCAIF